MMSRSPVDFLPGTLESLVLKTLTHGPMHGYRIARWLEDQTTRTLIVEEGSLYPALYRMEKRGWIEAEWGTSELGRRAKFYRLTRKDGSSSPATPRHGRRLLRRSIA